jgi:hypothetical protein
MKIDPCQPKINYIADSWAMENTCHFTIFFGGRPLSPSSAAQTLQVTEVIRPLRLMRR